jgi:hypothetical protein
MGDILAVWIGIFVAMWRSEHEPDSMIHGLGGGFIGGDG